jgi:hypothetical protein
MKLLAAYQHQHQHLERPMKQKEKRNIYGAFGWKNKQ